MEQNKINELNKKFNNGEINIYELIKELSPDGYEIKKISDIADVSTGKSNANDAVTGGLYPLYIRSKEIKTKNEYEYDEEAILIPGEGSIGDIFHYIKGKYALHQRVYRIHFINNNINTKYAYYYFINNFKSFIIKKAVSSTVLSIRKPMILDFEIPIPSLDAQNKIVEILDTFTQLTAQLTAELNLRKNQYKYYLNKLCSIADPDYISKEIKALIDKDGYEIKKLSDVCEINRGKRLTKRELSNNGKYKVYHGSAINYLGLYDKYNANINNILITNTGSIGDISILKTNAWCSDGCFYLNNYKENINPKFLYFFILKNKKYILNNIRSGAMPTIDKKIISYLDIPIPSLDAQNKIVEILDRFDDITNSIQEGLPKEIKLRQKQYEYYRNKLLNFDYLQ